MKGSQLANSKLMTVNFTYKMGRFWLF